MKLKTSLSFGIGSLLALCLMAVPADAQWRRRSRLDEDLGKNGRDIRALFTEPTNKATASVVRFVDRRNRTVTLGTVVGKEGWILTKASQVRGFDNCILPDGRRLPGEVVGLAEAQDLALVKVGAKDLKPIEWVTGTKKQGIIGQWLLTPGFQSKSPLALGVLSVQEREIPVRSGMMGILMEQASSRPVVSQVVSESGAEAAGFRVGDMVLNVEGQDVRRRDALIELVQTYRVGKTVEVTIQRERATLKLSVTLGARETVSESELLAGSLSNVRSGFPTALQHDSNLRPYQCGGPLVDIDGNAIGLNIARSSRTASYAIPVTEIQRLLPDMMSGKLAPPRITSKQNEDEKPL